MCRGGVVFDVWWGLSCQDAKSVQAEVFGVTGSPEMLVRGEGASAVGVFRLLTKRSIFSCGTGRFLRVNSVSFISPSRRLFRIRIIAFISWVLTFFSIFQRLNWVLYCFRLQSCQPPYLPRRMWGAIRCREVVASLHDVADFRELSVLRPVELLDNSASVVPVLDRLGSKWLCCRWSGEFLHLGKGRCRM